MSRAGYDSKLADLWLRCLFDEPAADSLHPEEFPGSFVLGNQHQMLFPVRPRKGVRVSVEGSCKRLVRGSAQLGQRACSSEILLQQSAPRYINALNESAPNQEEHGG